MQPGTQQFCGIICLHKIHVSTCTSRPTISPKMHYSMLWSQNHDEVVSKFLDAHAEFRRVMNEVRVRVSIRLRVRESYRVMSGLGYGYSRL